MVGCVRAMAGEDNLLVQFEYGKKKEISSSLLFLILKEGVEMDEPRSHYPKKQQSELLTIVGDPEVGEHCMFGKGMYLYVFYCLCYEMDIYTDMLEEQVLKEIYMDLN